MSPGSDREGPTVKSAGPRDAAKGKIEITPGNAARSKASNPEAFWDRYYQTHSEDADHDFRDFREKIGLLNANKKFRDVQAILTGYLRHHGKNAEPWMYTALAISLRMNKRGESEVKQALGYAADLAVRHRNPNDLVSVADQMVLMKEYDRVGPLLDQAMEIVPHRGEPILMSINLAQKTRDPKRMASAVDRLLALGWPGDAGFDESVRRDARKQVESLAKALREDARGDDADALLKRLTDSEARDVFVRLTWVGDADLDLAVAEPLGATARVRTPRTVFGGAIVKNGYGTHPEEVYVCPRGYDGDYTVTIETVYNNPDKPALKATLELITHEGTPEEKKETKTITLGPKSEPLTLTLKGGRRTTPLPYVLPTPVAAAAAARTAPAKPADVAKSKPNTKENAPARPAGR